MAAGALEFGKAWDGEFQASTDQLLLGRKLKEPAKAPVSSSSWTGASKPGASPRSYPGQGTKTDTRGRLLGVAKRSTQVMVRITPGKNRTMKSLAQHHLYIAREDAESTNDREEGAIGESLIDQDGVIRQGKEAVEELTWAWAHTGPELPEHSDTRMAFNIIFSMPQGTDAQAVYESVREASAVEFAGHQWVMAQHFDEPQVHCHVCVKAEGLDGQRFNPRKADLQRWRERFAYELRFRGIEAEATRRITRLQREKISAPWAVAKLQERGQPTNEQVSSSLERKEQWQRSADQTTASYEKIIGALKRSDEAVDRILAKQLADALGHQKSRSEKGRESRPTVEIERA